MPIRFFIKQWLMPPGVLLLLLLAAWWWRRRRPRLAAACFALGLGGLWLMSLPLVVEQAARQLETEPALAPQSWASLASRADAIVVLGAGRDRGDPAWGGSDQPSYLALERMRYAAQLAKASGLPVLTSGGLHYGTPPSEAQLMAERLQADFSVSVTWKEEASHTTWENAVLSAQVLQPLGIRRVVVVTQAWHMQRSRWSFERAGFEVVPAPVGFLGRDHARPFAGLLPESRAIWQSGQLLNEAVGLVGYRVFY
ncbi:YdcF family protein [Pseudomonas sichuanensis]|uniref:YdcF family protein n=1 Tax=Pseudomonas sichuanensis TaxID=2213015 RepID=UPI0024482607|nr:YdcF family protein [Pseudomonas sichuanensis]MDH0730666.1 YdcF family protein [Pseudomonas sichuanensis]MDH1584353.1 YdcF family protein [Pseudomonas sichuanensis]MDH1594829.1 YdcF family protein [Pseudomonas sichuanensis]MDH1599948.1 YdcF family protein [Pseudomonas sichuanensis]